MKIKHNGIESTEYKVIVGLVRISMAVVFGCGGVLIFAIITVIGFHALQYPFVFVAFFIILCWLACGEDAKNYVNKLK